MTYRQAIQKKITELEKVYDDAEHLRDVAVDEEKDYWNDVRLLTGQAMHRLNKMDNQLGERAHIKLKGKY